MRHPALSLSIAALALGLCDTTTYAQGLPFPDAPPESEAAREGVETHRFVALPKRVRQHLERNSGRVRAAGGKAARVGGETFLSPVFLGAILAHDLSRAGLERDPDKLGDIGHMVNTPDFYSSIGMFNVSLRAGDAAWTTAAKASRAAGLGRAVAPGSLGRVSASAVSHLRGNLVLATALTAPRLVRVDFGGATFSQMVQGDFSDLKLNVGKGDWGGWDELGITLGTFAVAGPPVRALVRGSTRRFAWPGLRKLGRIASRKIGARVARTAAVKGGLAVAPVPGTRVAAGLLTAGEVAWGVVELGGILFAAHELEAPITRWNDSRKMADDANGAVENLLTMARDVESMNSETRKKTQEEISKLEKKLEEEYQRMLWDLQGVALSEIRSGATGEKITLDLLKSLDPNELGHIHFQGLEFDAAKENYGDLVARFRAQADDLWSDSDRDRESKRKALERLYEQMFLELGHTTLGPLESFNGGRAITAERLARVSPATAGTLLRYSNVRFPLTKDNFLSVPHQLGGSNFQRVVSDRSAKIVELHEKLFEERKMLDPETAIEDAIVKVAMVFADARDYLYLEQGIKDETFLQRLSRWGESQEELGDMVNTIIEEVGPWEALPAQTLSLKLRYKDHGGLSGRDAGGLGGSYDRWLEDAKANVRQIYDAGNVSDDAITPRAREAKKKSGWGRLKFWDKNESETYHLADSWSISGNRRQLFEQEIRVYAEAMKLVKDPALKQRLGTEIAVVTALRSLDDEIVAGILADDPTEEELAAEAAVVGPRLPDPNIGLIGATESATSGR